MAKYSNHLPLGLRCKAARRMLGISQWTLAYHAGVSTPTLARFERTDKMLKKNKVEVVRTLRRYGVIILLDGVRFAKD